ncbi:glycosyl transferase group 1 [Scytonema hofmannii PCC 7110]|uniref:Glycosyl transferase group 1 n=1 Tax=Scytonema hofmannii PCC 7110 TaxID=128403 RepID=A0A139WWV5_9CYAN|nr:glycosyltransferase family 4 protein [Scytonema hofmannii]KYC36862.1 glycosyl transferase group 1 [Scytonema hofmannii PCC 7110]
MKIIHVPFCFYPHPVGGTEVYVEALSRHLQQQGLQILIAAPGNVNESYFHNRLPVRRFAVSNQVKRLQEVYGEGDRQSAIEFGKLLDEEQPDLVHLHAFTRGVSLRLVRVAKQRKIPVIFTYHTPTVSCQRGSLMRWGTQVCDGKVDLRTCSQCTLQGLGLNWISASAISNLPPIIGHSLRALNLHGGIWTALRMTELASYRYSALQGLLSEVDHVVAVCDWVKDILIRNHVSCENITVSRQGLCQEILSAKTSQLGNNTTENNSFLKIAFLGRIEPIKGIDILLKAFQTTPQLAATLDIYGISQNSASDAYQTQLLNLVKQDTRISFKSPVSPTQVVNLLTDYDLLAVPSQWLETGPLVVLEAFAAGIPVIGSNLGGIAELVQHGVNGILVEPASVDAWIRELQRLSQEQDLLTHLRRGVRPPRHMETVAEEMLSLYNYILQKSNKVL